MANDVVRFIGSIAYVRYSTADSDCKITTMRVSKVEDGELKKDPWGNVTFKGEMDLIPSTNYIISGRLVKDKKFGDQYTFLNAKREHPVEDMTPKEFRRFLTEITGWAEDINKKYKDPKPIFEEHNVEALTAISGIGKSRAESILDKYEKQKDYGPAYAAFGQWGFTMLTTRKLVRYAKSVDRAVKMLEENPYDFMGVAGIGFKTIDKKALESGIAINDQRRVRAFIRNYFDDMEMGGSSWVTKKMLFDYLTKEIFNCDIKATFDWISQNDDYVVLLIDGEECVADAQLYETEKNIAKELHRLLQAKKALELKGVDKVIEKVEVSHGWKYSEEQLNGIQTMLQQNVSLLRGPGGVGKTASLNAVVKSFQNNGLSVATCALSGKAADNLTQLTGLRGSTIHRLIGIQEDGKAMFDEEMPLPYDVIILDEVSMVDVKLFYKLVRAIRSGSTFIMVGDSAQLDSIGVGVMRGIVNSNVIPVITLRRIHRQAQDSAIVTHSLTYRTGKMPQVTEKDSWHRLGINKDLGYVFENPDNEDKIMDDAFMVYQQMMKKYDVASIQLLTPMTSNCFALNNKVQEIANPKSKSKNEYVMYPNSDYSYILREGDKILNTSNNYDTISANNEAEILPIFTGTQVLLKN